MLNNEDIVSDLLKAGEIFQIGDSYFPRYKRSEKSGKLINIETDREAHISQACSYPTTGNFFRYFNEYLDTVPDDKKHLLRTIQEFPFIIYDQDLWNNLYTPDPDSKDPTTKNYFMGDIFLPELSFLIELQSSFHKAHEKYDTARAEYIYQKYGISVIQLNGFGGDPDKYSWRRTQKKEMYRLISELGPKLSSPKPVTSNIDEIAEWWKKEHKDISEFYGSIRESIVNTSEKLVLDYPDSWWYCSSPFYRVVHLVWKVFRRRMTYYYDYDDLRLKILIYEK